MTYLVVRLREQRMLVVPISRFLDSSFGNWTLAASDVIGSVLISMDFTAPVDAVRAELASARTEHEGRDQPVRSTSPTRVNAR
jgi:hypothetical protein